MSRCMYEWGTWDVDDPACNNHNNDSPFERPPECNGPQVRGSRAGHGWGHDSTKLGGVVGCCQRWS